MSDYHVLPPGLPVPEDDGGADHLPGAALPDVRLPSTLGGALALTEAGDLLVAYVYPRTGTPGEPSPTGWDDIPGARGCTPQSCAFRDHAADLAALGASVVGVSAQTPAEQRAFAEREHIPYPLLADPGLALGAALGLPTFSVEGLTLYRRITLIARGGRIEHVFHPVFPPDRNAADVVAWLQSRTKPV